MDSLNLIWNSIIKEVAQFQEDNGNVKNSILGGYFLRETAFAAKLFLVQYKITKEKKYLKRSQNALNAVLSNLKNTIKFDEPVWKPRGIGLRKGSLPATVMVFEALFETLELMENTELYYEKNNLVDYIKSCKYNNGIFAHDEIVNKNYGGLRIKGFGVINTSAMALYLMSEVNQREGNNIFENKLIQQTYQQILNSQRDDGLWTYVFPLFWQKAMRKLYLKIPKRYAEALKSINNKIFKDSSIFFGDTIHHAIVIYYLLKSDSNLSDMQINSIQKAWQFIEDKFIFLRDGSIKIDFSWEPKPISPRYCNFLDTTSYFIVLHLLNKMKCFGFISKNSDYINGLSKYVANSLLHSNKTPCISPYDGPEDIIANIFPRPAESVVHKGFLISDLILEGYDL